MTIEEIYSIPTNGEGWRLLPNGKRVKFGTNIRWTGTKIDATVGDWAKVGDCAKVGGGIPA